MTEHVQDGADLQSNILNQDLSGLSDKELSKVLTGAAGAYGCEAVPVLEELAAGSDSGIASAACDALGTVRDVCSANALLRIRESAKDKAVRKKAGHALHRLRSSGIEPDETLQPEGEVPRFARSGRVEMAYASHYDAAGMRLLVMGLRPPGRPLFQTIWAISQEKGIHDSFVRQTGKRGFLQWIDEFRAERSGLSGLFEIEPDHCRYIANEAYENTIQSGVSLPDGVGIFLGTVNNMPDLPEKPIIYKLMDEEEVRSDLSALSKSASLLDLEECLWRLSEDEVGEYPERVREILSSVIITSDSVREERLQKTVDDYIETEFSSEMRSAYQRRLEETAYLFVLDGKTDYARLAFSVALKMESGEDLPRVPFIRGLVERSIGIIRPESREAKELEKRMAEMERSRLVKPVSQDRAIGEILKEIRRR
ncbi:MAG: HEAT repeat domain-containing protein [Bacillota bacterium]|nr:HEAT repeat domain-containing protein [Bacillota bacterium]NLD12048.1 HEAT repeat domain-containing protein [Bacillota bacterium]HCD41859.1 hypothetical protein [Bacillota bacterium]HOB89042.1 HEAT repeat domain-containing protein [Bacillota bacterium]HOJ57959.1 HEAT repeat domain-containing protein [Bacillota bacterium]